MIEFEINEDSLNILLNQTINEKAKKAMGKVCALVEKSAKENAHKDTGALRRSITSEIETEGNTIIGSIYTPLEYAPYVEYGTGKYAEGGNGRSDVPWFIPIGENFPLSKAEKYNMRIFTAPDGTQFAMTFGSKPHPYMRPALEDNKEKILEIFEEAFK